MSAREDFTKAIRFIVDAGKIDLGPAPYLGGYGKKLEAACDAFADAVCDSGSDLATCTRATDGTEEAHDCCRATLRRECGL